MDAETSNPLDEAITSFADEIDSIVGVLPGIVLALQELGKLSKEKLDGFEADYCEIENGEDSQRIRVPNNHFREWRTLQRKHTQVNRARVILPRGLIIALVSQFDAYIGALLRAVFLMKPELLNASERTINLAELMRCISVQDARERLIEKEIEGVLRTSHSDQFKYLERLFSVPLTKDLLGWLEFIELTERRNLFVHADGIVSDQYMSVCKTHGVQLGDEVSKGAALGVPQDYFMKSSRYVYSIGVKLGHVVWRKLFPEQRLRADEELVHLTFDLLDRGRNKTAADLLDFACETMKKFSNERNRLVFTVNRAQAYKWLGETDRCSAILDSVDWSATDQPFRLAEAVLRARWSDAERLMRQIGVTDGVAKVDYRDWPLFKEWRDRPEFLAAYEDIFGERFDAKSESQRIEAQSEPETPAEGSTTLH